MQFSRKKLSRSLVSLGAVAAISALAFAGCARAEEPAGGAGGDSTTPAGGTDGGSTDISVGVALPQRTSENWVLAENLFNEGLAEAGFEPEVQFANNGATEQQNQISAMVANGVDYLIVGAVDGTQLGTQLQQAKDAGITVIAYDRLLLNTENVDYYIAYDNFQVGELQGEALLDGMQSRTPEGPYNIELFAGSPDDANSTPFFEGAMSVLQPRIDDGTLVVQSGQVTQDAAATQGWLAQNAQSRMDTLLAGFYSNAELDGVLSPNDTLARAIITSVQAAGKPVPIVTGQDSEVESVRSIMDGVQYSTINKDTRELVSQTIDMVTTLQAGGTLSVPDMSDNGVKEVPTAFLVPQIVTAENAADAYADDPTLGPIVSE